VPDESFLIRSFKLSDASSAGAWGDVMEVEFRMVGSGKSITVLSMDSTPESDERIKIDGKCYIVFMREWLVGGGHDPKASACVWLREAAVNW
jgi:hypothetical protein